MTKNIDEVEFTIFDTETTGLEASSGDRIVEIAGVRLRGRQRLGTFQTLVNPQREISEGAFLVNKITPEMLKDAPLIQQVIHKFLDFIQGSLLCSYNAGFDLEFLNNELKLSGRAGLEDIVVIDILKMARRLLPGIERHALWFVAESLGIKSGQQHRALSDVELTLGVFQKLKDTLKEKGVSDTASFTNLFALNTGLLEDLNLQKRASIQEAIDLGVKIRMRYLSSSNVEVTEREVIPEEIRKEHNRFYLVGYCCLRNEERTFNIDGILHLEIV